MAWFHFWSRLNLPAHLPAHLPPHTPPHTLPQMPQKTQYEMP